jgi:aminoglycoside 6'-N-acetyltransferase
MTALRSFVEQRAVYTFRPMTAADLPMVRGWLVAPHVRAWWGDPADQFGLVSGDLNEPDMDQFIVVAGGRPFAYLQCYWHANWAEENGLGTHPAETRGIDQFIGEADMVDRGHGSAFIGSFVDGLLGAGTPRVITDPDPANGRAVRAYQKAGFRKVREVDTPDGPALLMIKDRSAPSTTRGT